MGKYYENLTINEAMARLNVTFDAFFLLLNVIGSMGEISTYQSIRTQVRIIYI